MALVSEDLITEILLRLPVKSVVRFKVVSKKWLSIVSSPLFRQTHASRSSMDKVAGLLIKKTPSRNSLPVHGFIPLSSEEIRPSLLRTISNRNIHLSSSSGGLLLFQQISCRSSHLLQLGDVQDYFICNPTTNEYKQIALAFAPRSIADSIFVSSYLAFDPRKSPHYKIVFLCELSEQFSEIFVYSSETERFSSPKPVKLTYSKLCIHGGYYSNDAIHWISDDNNLYYFDLNKEKMKDCQPLPFAFNDCKYFGESLGHLFLATVVGGRLFVYQLKSDYSDWLLNNQLNNQLCHVFCSQVRHAFWKPQLKILGIIGDKNNQFQEMVNYHIPDYSDSVDNKFYSWSYMGHTLACV